MLVLSRRIGEEIVIAGDVKIRILQGKGNRVSVGIEAPPHVSIQRAELLENAAACQAGKRLRVLSEAG